MKYECARFMSNKPFIEDTPGIQITFNQWVLFLH